jgi:hypothetical protein
MTEPPKGAKRHLRLIVPNWYGVASVKWLKRIDVITDEYEGSSRSVITCTSGPINHTSRSRSCACARPDHRPRSRRDPPRRHIDHARKGLVGHRTGDERRPQPHRRRRMARGETRIPERPVSMAGLVVRVAGDQSPDGTHCAHTQPTPPATFNQMSHPGIGSATGTTRSRCPTSTCADAGSRARRAEVVKGGQGRR